MPGTITPQKAKGDASRSGGYARQERLIAQIVRDFMTAYRLARRVGTELQEGTLEFSTVDRLVGDSPRSVLYRLKEDCHALFREPAAQAGGAPRAEELFDLAVGALFHEAMKFRESYYLFTAYGPRARRRVEEASAGPLAERFQRLFDAGYKRMLESESEMEELFRETREQLRVLLREWADAGEIARSLLAEPRQTEAVFSLALSDLLSELYGSVPRAYALAILSLLRSGHYREAADLLDRPGVSPEELPGVSPDLVRGLATYYGGDPCGALRRLGAWVRRGGDGEPEIRARARALLGLIAHDVEERHPALADDARRLESALSRPHS